MLYISLWVLSIVVARCACNLVYPLVVMKGRTHRFVDYSPTRYATIAWTCQLTVIGIWWLTSKVWTFVLKLRSLTCSTLPRSIKCGSASPQVAGTASSESLVYASNVNVPIQHQLTYLSDPWAQWRIITYIPPPISARKKYCS